MRYIKISFAAVFNFVDGEVYSWGRGRRGRLGRGSEEDSPVPGLVRFPHKDSLVVNSLSISHGNTLLVANRNT